jgi:hypothetical protein
MNQPRMPSPAILVAVLALVAALVGTAVAGPDASTSAITKKKVKKIVRKEIDKRIASLPEGPLGPQGPRGAPGEDATNLFAYIRDTAPLDTSTATVTYRSGVTSVADPAAQDGVYTVTFNRSVEHCVVQATPGFGKPPGSGPAAVPASLPFSAMDTANANTAVVEFRNTAGNMTDTSFLVTAFC